MAKRELVTARPDGAHVPLERRSYSGGEWVVGCALAIGALLMPNAVFAVAPESTSVANFADTHDTHVSVDDVECRADIV